MTPVMLILVLSVLPLVKDSVYLYNTEDSLSLEFYDCIYHKSLFYCRRPIGPISLHRDNVTWRCYHNGTRHSFTSLELSKVNARIVLHKWKSTTEMVEKYSRYIRKSFKPDSDNEQYLCECKHPQSFGKNCEYLLPKGVTFQETLDWEVKMRSENQWLVQMHGDILCYTTLLCSSGLLCLDWRDICDGVQQCMSGYDEENCDKLEFNECEDDEYRCMNGMCIPDEYFLDGEYDCMDATDEKGMFNDTACTFQQASPECDDRVCLPNEWSCGDGQCISDRLAFQKESPMSNECKSRRDQYHMCETHYNDRLWTLPNGKCYGSSDYEELYIENRNATEECVYFMKCALSEGLEENCPCKNDPSCIDELENPCPFPIIQYPNGGIVAPYVFHFYNATRNWLDSTPDFIELNATIKCRGYMIARFLMRPYLSEFSLRMVEEYLCNSAPDSSEFVKKGYDQFCYNDSRTFNNRSYYSIDVCKYSRECFSAYRIQDGYRYCADELDEYQYGVVSNTCSRVKHHRFRCSAKEPTCLFVSTLGDLWTHCKNNYDESWMGTETRLSKIKCDSESKDDCRFIRQYIEASWNIDYGSTLKPNSARTIPFRAYCDTFWNLGSKNDEDLAMCRKWWVCLDEQWQCRNGQCINAEWVLDGEWDCFDASDEEGIFISNHSLLFRNLKVVNRSVIESRFKAMYSHQPLSTICNSRTEFPCFRINMSRSLINISHNRPCISLDKIGDGLIDCIGALDERNTLEYCNRPTMLGRDFKCLTSNTCIAHSLICESRCPNKADDDVPCYGKEELSDCSEPSTDFRCLNGQCAKNGWCDGIYDCSHGEDEYLCEDPDSVRLKSSNAIYRSDKERNVRYDKQVFRLPSFPVETNTRKLVDMTFLTKRNTPTITALPDLLFSSVPYVCNRGVGVLMYNVTVACFCPQQYYGDKCQFHNDRITIKLHLNFSQSIYAETSNSEIVLKILVLFLFDDQTLTSFEFHARPAVEMTTYSKKIDHVIYSRSNKSLHNKLVRYLNRSKIVLEHPYSIRIEAYEIKTDEKAQLIAVWQYSVYFDYLPSFRFAKVLRFTKLKANENPCLSNPCGNHRECHQLLNQKTNYVCLCPSNFSGSDCLDRDEKCSHDFCSANALCKPTYRGLLNGNELPYCICPNRVFGLRCELVHDQCDSNPCRKNGTCLPSAAPGRYFCICAPFYHGNECELEKEAVRLYINQSVEHRGAVVQYFDIDFSSLNLILAHQDVYHSHPDSIHYFHSRKTAPAIVLFKLYSNTQAEIYLISVRMNVVMINGTTYISEKNRCVHVRTLFETSKETSPFKYHHLCIKNSSMLCFYDDSYLCICDESHSSTECFGYDHHLDRCSRCLAGGKCLKGDQSQADDYICLCPQCHSGRQCEFNSQSFSFTLDQLFSADLLSSSLTFYLLIVGAWVVFMLGLVNNIFSFTTFRRPKCQYNGIGQYLLSMSIMNQINLGFLASRLTHLTINITSHRSNSFLDIIFCKLLNYLLTASSRITFWLVSLIAIERAYVTLFINGQWLTKPHIARRLIILTCAGILSMGSYELAFVTSHFGLNDGKSSICVLDFPSHYPAWAIIHKVVTVINALLPFLINIFCMVTIICVVVKKKMNLSARDDYTPITTIVLSLDPAAADKQQHLISKSSKVLSFGLIVGP